MKDFKITSAAYANSDHTAAIVMTEDNGAVAVSILDTPDIWSAVLAFKPDRFTVPQSDLALATKAECQRRIYAVVDQIAQVNLAAAAAGGVLTSKQMTDYRAGLIWIASMRAACGTLIARNDLTFVEDEHWPEPAATIVTLATAF